MSTHDISPKCHFHDITSSKPDLQQINAAFWRERGLVANPTIVPSGKGFAA
jgi:hypothetical protein